MNICGMEIPDNANVEFFGSPLGLNLSRVARLNMRNNGTKAMIHVTEFTSGLKDFEENDLLNGVICKIKFIERINQDKSMNQDKGELLAEIISGEFKGTILFLKLDKEGWDVLKKDL